MPDFSSPLVQKGLFAVGVPGLVALVLAGTLLFALRKSERDWLKWMLGTLVTPAAALIGAWALFFFVYNGWEITFPPEEDSPHRWARWMWGFTGLSALLGLWVAGVWTTSGGPTQRWLGTTGVSIAAGAVAWWIGSKITYDSQPGYYAQLLGRDTLALFAITLPLAHLRISGDAMLGLCAVGGAVAVAVLFGNLEAATLLTMPAVAALGGVLLLALPIHARDRRQAKKSGRKIAVDPAADADSDGEESVQYVRDTPAVFGLLAGGLGLAVVLPMLLMLGWLNSFNRTGNYAWAMALPLLAIPALWLVHLPRLRGKWHAGVIAGLTLAIAALGSFVWTASSTDLSGYGLEQLNELGIPTPAKDEDAAPTAADYGY